MVRWTAVMLGLAGVFAGSGCAARDVVSPMFRHTVSVDVAEAARAPAVLAPHTVQTQTFALEPAGPGRWTHTSRVIGAPDGFTEALVSWNVRWWDGPVAPPPGASAREAGFMVEVRVAGNAEGSPVREWSPWLIVGVGGTLESAQKPPPEMAAFTFSDGSPGGKIDVDYFVADAASSRRLTTLQYRVTLAGLSEGAFDPAGRIERVGVTLTRPDGDRVTPRARPDPDASRVVRLDVPFRSQRTPNPALAGRLCSPSSTAMVLAYAGAPVSDTASVAEQARDPAFDLFGNWPRNVQAAFEFGVPGYVARFDDWAVVERTLAHGRPIVVSIRAGPGELPEAPYRTTVSGHLIVITGVDARGDFFVSDPAAATPQRGQRVYSRANLARVWMGHRKGTAYVLLTPDPEPAP
jgi:uncharacterized protein YvpB